MYVPILDLSTLFLFRPIRVATERNPGILWSMANLVNLYGEDKYCRTQ